VPHAHKNSKGGRHPGTSSAAAPATPHRATIGCMGCCAAGARAAPTRAAGSAVSKHLTPMPHGGLARHPLLLRADECSSSHPLLPGADAPASCCARGARVSTLHPLRPPLRPSDGPDAAQKAGRASGTHHSASRPRRPLSGLPPWGRSQPPAPARAAARLPAARPEPEPACLAKPNAHLAARPRTEFLCDHIEAGRFGAEACG